MRIHNTIRVAIALGFLSPASALGAGGHDSIGCTGCHSMHAAKDRILFSVAPNKKRLDARTNQPYVGITALCLACHEEPEKGGQGYLPVSEHIPHPFSVENPNPRVARVPEVLLRENGRFGCVSCHDPHPSNPNAKYLRVNVGNRERLLDGFCVVCHVSKADPSKANPALFTSMDERGPTQTSAHPR